MIAYLLIWILGLLDLMTSSFPGGLGGRINNFPRGISLGNVRVSSRISLRNVIAIEKQGAQRDPTGTPGWPKGSQRTANGSPKALEREPKAPKPPTRAPTSAPGRPSGDQGHPKGSHRESKVVPKEAPGTQRHPREASGPLYICKLPINCPSSRYVTLCWKSASQGGGGGRVGNPSAH